MALKNERGGKILKRYLKNVKDTASLKLVLNM
jgi:hypothetical protein